MRPREGRAQDERREREKEDRVRLPGDPEGRERERQEGYGEPGPRREGREREKAPAAPVHYAPASWSGATDGGPLARARIASRAAAAAVSVVRHGMSRSRAFRRIATSS